MDNQFIPLDFQYYSTQEIEKRISEFSQLMKKRRTVRDFSAKEVPEKIILEAVSIAGSAPSGANLQPWFFSVVKSKEVKKQIRKLAEENEEAFYEKIPEDWMGKLKPLGTGKSKPFLEEAPYLIVVFEKKYEIINGKKSKLYYTRESVGLATGFLITALHYAGLATLTYTPTNMLFLNDVLNRPKNEKPFMVILTGYPKENTKVPKIEKKPINKICEVV